MAKPRNWDKMTELEKETMALRLLRSMRGQLIISQALVKAIDVMNKVEPAVMREQSNIEDMEILLDVLFPMYAEIEKAKAAGAPA